VASTSTDPASGATSGARTPAPLDAGDLDRVPGVLGRIARERAADYADTPLPGAPTVAREGPGRLMRALRAPGLQVIAEIKRGSPSQGPIADLDPVAAAEAYRRGGAAALSVLTERRHFGGELAHLRAVAAAVPLPALRKEFIVHPAQVAEAAEVGAAAVLLIAAVLGERLAAYLAFARACGLDALVEVHDEDELRRALAAGAEVLGVNNRDLRSLEVDRGTAPRLLRLARDLGFRGATVAESGYARAEDLDGVLGLADAALIGTALAGSGDLEGALRRLRQNVATLEASPTAGDAAADPRRDS
jgi:indole-3-glycerol phosphate synthase